MPHAIRTLVTAAVLAALGCAMARTQSVDHETGRVSVDATGSLSDGDLGLVPNEDSVVEAARGCALIGDGLAPRLVTAHELGRTEMGNMWVRYTFQCEFGSEPSTAVD